MSMTEILDVLSKLERSQRDQVRQRLDELELAEIDETPAHLAAIDAGRRSVRKGKMHTIEQSREMLEV